jgi:hypothetical protein
VTRARSAGPFHAHRVPVAGRALVTKPGKVLTHRQLLREVWGPAYVERGHYLRIYMGHCARSWKPTQPNRATCSLKWVSAIASHPVS